MDNALIDEATFESIRLIPDDQLLHDFWPQIAEIVEAGGLGGERPDEAVRRYYETVFKPKLALLAHQNYQAAVRLRKVIAENALDMSLISVGLVASCVIDIQNVPQKPEQKVLAGFALLILKLALKRPKDHGNA